MPVDITCLHCGKTVSVYPSKASQRFCSKNCSFAHHRTQKTCVICGKTFVLAIGQAKKEQATCLSEECKKAIKIGKHNPFYGRKHSSESKKKVSKAKTLPRMKVSCTCGCGELMEVPGYRIRANKTGAFFVDIDHFHQWLEGENHWNYRGGNIYYGDGWKKTAQSIRERDKVCQRCGKTPEENGRALDVHHINPARVSQDNSPDNLIALCMSCHQKLQSTERYEHPYKVAKYRKCLTCNRLFVPEPFQRFCSPECRRKRKREREKKHRTTHPAYAQRRAQRIKHWQETHPEKLREYSRRQKQREYQSRSG